jgi:hypothetical protein
MPRFTRRYPAILNTLIKQMLDLVQVSAISVWRTCRLMLRMRMLTKHVGRHSLEFGGMCGATTVECWVEAPSNTGVQHKGLPVGLTCAHAPRIYLWQIPNVAAYEIKRARDLNISAGFRDQAGGS